MSSIEFPKIYNPANQTPQELVENFVVRTELFKELFNDIKNAEMKHPELHYLIQGIRGQGKTTMLLRVAYEINNDPVLKQRLIPIIFNEEQYNISRLFKLWETIAEYLEEDGSIIGLYDKMQQLDANADYEKNCLKILESGLQEHNKKAILFIDNIDEILKKFSSRELQRLREVFMNSAELRIIATSSVKLEHHYDYGQPFYEFFRVHILEGLTTSETKTMLIKLGERYDRIHVKEIIDNQPGRVEALRRLTGGVIRTIVILFDVFVNDIDGNAFLDLERILDSVTPLYKHRMDILSPQQQEIIDFVALNWDAATAKEIAQKIKLQSKAVSAQLKQLEKYHIIETEKINGKNLLYRISERFFNIWYLMRLGRKWDEKRVRFLVEFLNIWCDKEELEKRAQKHIDAIRKGKLNDKHALFMTEALARTSIQKELQHQLITETKSYLQRAHSELNGFLSDSDYEIHKAATEALELNHFEKAIRLLEKVKNKDHYDYNALGLAYAISKIDFEKAKEYFQRAVEQQHPYAMYNLAMLYQNELDDIKKAEQYYLMAVEKKHVDAMHHLASLYHVEYKDLKKAEHYYLMAIEEQNANADAMFNLAMLYHRELKDFDKAQQYYLMAIEHEHVEAMYHLGLFFEYELNNLEKAEHYYGLAVERENFKAMNNLAWLNFEAKKNRKKSLYYAETAYENRPNVLHTHTYAVVLLWNNEFEKAFGVANEFLDDHESFELFPNHIIIFLMLLMAKKQYYYALKIFNQNRFDLKDRFKPIYYALMFFIQDEYPREYMKMGGELKETVEEIIKKVNQMETDYQ